jgi:hypothetical protein
MPSPLILLNSRGATTSKVFDEAVRRSVCQTKNDAALVTFDTYCSLTPGAAHGNTKLKIRRWVGEQELSSPQGEFLLP